jgi:cellulose biosynthesis protein BcsQ
MSVYALWNNKGGVGKSYLTFQIACEYARQHPEVNVLVLDACPQSNSTIMLLGGIEVGEENLDTISTATPLRTISGYVEDRIRSPIRARAPELPLFTKYVTTTPVCPRMSF